jgi:hypothetical protein
LPTTDDTKKNEEPFFSLEIFFYEGLSNEEISAILGNKFFSTFTENSPHVNLLLQMRKFFTARNKTEKRFHLYWGIFLYIKKKNHFLPPRLQSVTKIFVGYFILFALFMLI